MEVYQTRKNKDTLTSFPITFTNKCLTTLRVGYGNDTVSTHNLQFREWCIASVNKASLLTKAADPATSVMYIVFGI